MTNEPTILRDAAFMQTFLDLLIPPSDDGKLPGAGSLGLSSDLAEALEANDAVVSGLQAVQEAALEQ